MATLTVFTTSSPGLPCKVGDCGKTGKLKNGYCNAHYLRLLRHGDPLAGGRERTPYENPEQEFLGRTRYVDHGLIWVGPLNGPYGRMRSRLYAHRYAWERVNGDIPEGFVVDHDPMCPKICVDVSHLNLYTISDHIKVGWARGEQDGGWPRRSLSPQDPITGRFVKC